MANRRSLALDAAVLLAAFGGAATCASVLTLFIGALRDTTVASVLFTTFGLAVMCTIGAIGAFTAEMLMAGSGVRPKSPQGGGPLSKSKPGEPADPPQLRAMLAPYPAEEMTCWPVSARVGNVRNNDPSFIEPDRSQRTCMDGSPRCSSS